MAAARRCRDARRPPGRQDLGGGPDIAALLEPSVPGRSDPCEERHLLAPQPRRAAPKTRGNPTSDGVRRSRRERRKAPDWRRRASMSAGWLMRHHSRTNTRMPSELFGPFALGHAVGIAARERVTMGRRQSKSCRRLRLYPTSPTPEKRTASHGSKPCRLKKLRRPGTPSSSAALRELASPPPAFCSLRACGSRSPAAASSAWTKLADRWAGPRPW